MQTEKLHVRIDVEFRNGKIVPGQVHIDGERVFINTHDMQLVVPWDVIEIAWKMREDRKK